MQLIAFDSMPPRRTGGSFLSVRTSISQLCRYQAHLTFLLSFFSSGKGRGPDSGGQRPELPQHPARRGGEAPQVLPPPHPDGQGRREAAPRPDHGGRDQVDHQLPDRRDGDQPSRVRLLAPPWGPRPIQSPSSIVGLQPCAHFPGSKPQ